MVKKKKKVEREPIPNHCCSRRNGIRFHGLLDEYYALTKTSWDLGLKIITII